MDCFTCLRYDIESNAQPAKGGDWASGVGRGLMVLCLCPLVLLGKRSLTGNFLKVSRKKKHRFWTIHRSKFFSCELISQIAPELPITNISSS